MSVQCHYCNYLPHHEYLCDPTGPGVCQPCKRLAEIEEQVKSIRRMLVGLENERQTLKTQVNRHHDRLIHRLPREIVSEIFEFCLPEDLMEAEFEGIPPKYSLSAPLVISAICRTWRAIALSAPRLWKTITIWSRFLPSAILVQNWIDRAGQLPLSIVLRLPFGEDETAIPIINTLTRYSKRWQELRCRMPAHLFSHFPTGIEDLPELRTLHLNNLRGTLRNTPLNLHPPRLNIFSFSGTRLCELDFDWTYLTQLSMEVVTPAIFLEVLRRAPALEKCTVQTFFIPEDESDDEFDAAFPPLPNPFVHSTLQELSIPADLCNCVFKQLQCPSLSALNLNPDCFAIGFDMPLVLEFLEKSRCSLERLSIMADSIPLSVSDITLICKRTQTLRDLSIRLITDDDAVVSVLRDILSQFSNIDGTVESLYLPALRSLSIKHDWDASDIYWMIPDIFGFYTLPECPSEYLYHRHALKTVTIIEEHEETEVDGALLSEIELEEITLKKTLWLRKAGVNLMFQVGEVDLIELTQDSPFGTSLLSTML
ncbi:hypothetical protein BDN70DRAFT_879415 [Pholiota conissans]|uniref:F-box domain-containing protein n=1 Tax=Pholiota conissans TaxID=109636 RepID=A0A9P5Z1E0_9AGAR|nr:hypothetical protein BDN70DRAFT_879415 [Pholiota conissans]